MNDDIKIELVTRLKHQSTWRLLLLAIITFAVYFAYYIKRQSTIVNEYLDDADKISVGLITTITILCYVSLIMFVPYMIVEDGHPIEKVSDLIDLVCSIAILVWGLKVRSRMNYLLDSDANKGKRFSLLWTLSFSPLYFNYKINKIGTND